MRRPPGSDNAASTSDVTEAASNDRLRAFVSRIRERKAEARAINDIVRAIYSEAKVAGLNKTVLGDVVSYIEKREKDPDTLADRSALFDRYLSEYDGTKTATHAHAPANVVTPAEQLHAAQPPPHATPASPAADPTAIASGVSRSMRPAGCLNPETCASSRWRDLCHGCQKALDSQTHNGATPAEQT